MNVSTIVNIIVFGTSILNLMLGSFIFISNPKNPINKRFFYFASVVSLWVFGLFILQIYPNLFWGKFIYTFALLIPLSFNSFLNSLLYQDRKRIETDILIISIAMLPILGLLYNNLILSEVVFPGWGVDFRLGAFYPAFTFYFVPFMGLAFIKLISKYRQTMGAMHKQIKFIFLGTFISACTGITSSIILPSVGYSKLYNLGPTSTLFVVLFTAYAITKTGLMDIRVVIGKTLAHILTILGLGSIYATFVLLYVNYISSKIDWLFFVLTIIIGVFVGNFYIRIKDHIQTPADRFFIKSWYDFPKVTTKITSAFTQINSRSQIAAQISKILKEEVDIQDLTFFFPEKDGFIGYDKTSFEPNLKNAVSLQDENLIKAIQTKDIIFLEKENTFKSVLLVPILDKDGELIAFFAPGKKRSEENYTNQDLELLRMVGKNISMSLEFIIKPYEEVKKEFEATQKKLIDTERILSRSERIASMAKLVIEYNHEIKTPLAIIGARLIDLPDEPTEMKEIKEKLLKQIYRAKDIMETTFINLIKNAHDNTPAGGKINVKTYTAVKDDKTMVCVEVSDTGCGIPKENLEKIFEPFFSTHVTEGRGLGLATVHSLVREHLGVIEVESVVGAGSTFKVKLPAIENSAHA